MEIKHKITVTHSESVKIFIEFHDLSNILLLLFDAIFEALIVLVHPSLCHHGYKSKPYKGQAITLNPNDRFIITITHLMIRNKKLTSERIPNSNLITSFAHFQFFSMIAE